MKRIICENIRSAYNVGNIVRTADALNRGVIISGYSAPLHHPKVQKTALGAQEDISNQHFLHPQQTLDRLRGQEIPVIAAEKSETSISLEDFSSSFQHNDDIAIIVGNEIVGVMKETLEQVDYIVHIPMLGMKESLNVGQAAAIFMREMR